MTKRLPHTDLVPGSIPTAVITCGDPARATQIAEQLDEHELVAEKREYRTYVGKKNGRSLTVTSHGIGAPGAAIAFEELIAAGARQIIRVGTCGSLQPYIKPGELVIASAAVQRTGYVREVAPDGYPAVADVALVLALQEATVQQSVPAYTGIVLTRDAFYSGVENPHTPFYAHMAEANVLAVEMECAALFVVGSLRGVQTAAILAADGYVLESAEDMATFGQLMDEKKTAVAAAIDVAIQVILSTNLKREFQTDMSTDNVVQELEKRFFPHLNEMKEQIIQKFPNVNTTIWSHSFGAKTKNQGHQIGLDCSFTNVDVNQPDNVAMVIAFRHLATVPEIVSADVCWENGHIETELLSSPIKINETTLEELENGLPVLFNALLLVIERGQPS
ncbi:MAG: nucleoside phosphorylase [Anaerolineae bacterium]|nr:nucleoside phosphorylase [Anaerolineae bacterium]